jgi:hypothetical protein
MELEVTAGSGPARMASLPRRFGTFLGALAWRAALIAFPLAAWTVHQGGFYTPASDLGYWLGVAGGSLMLLLLLYPLRKRFASLAVLGPIRIWFRFHLLGGICGPLLVLFHSAFHVGSFNAAIALGSMLLVVGSGLVGRFIYRKIHRGLYGSRETAAELQRAMTQQLSAMQAQLARLPALEREIARFVQLATHPPAGRWWRAAHFASLGWRRHLASRRVRRAIRKHDFHPGHPHASPDPALVALAATIDATLQAVQRAAQFSTFERLFSLWHVVHIPFLCMLVISALIHVLAVHAY